MRKPPRSHRFQGAARIDAPDTVATRGAATALIVAAALCLAVVHEVAAEALAPAESNAEQEFFPVDEYVGDDGLTGDDIYTRVVANRFDAFEQTSSLRSGGENGRFQDVRLRLRYKNFSNDGGKVVSKTIAKYFEPSDVRHLGYLVINKHKGPDDQFVYRPSARKVRRVNVRGEAIAGTDFSFEDVVPPEFGDGSHHRMPDDEIEGRPVFVVTVVPHASTESEYSKLRIAIEKDHYVPIQTHYWDNKRVLVKRLDADPTTISQHQARENGELKQVWIVRHSRMTQLKLGTFTELNIAEFEADPKLRNRHFSERELTASR